MNAPFISSALNYVCNKFVSPGIFPLPLKYAIIKPLFKMGDKKNMANYRPVSLLTTFSKVLGKVIYKRFLICLNKHNILVNEKFGFRPKSSIEKASYTLIHET